MIAKISELMRPILEFPLIRKVRRNHALEHATFHMLSRKQKDMPIAAHSNNNGFIVIGNVPTDVLESAVKEAITRLQNGESQWALHPNCGTNLATAGGLTTFSGWLGFGRRKKLTLDRISWTMTLMLVSMLVAPSLGTRIQEHITTKGDIGDLEFLQITRRELKLGNRSVVTHAVITRRG